MLAKILLSLTLAGGLLLGGTAQALELKISTLYPDGTAAVNALKAAGETLRARTDGRVSLRIYPGGVMGDDQAVQRRIRIGQLHGTLAQGGAFSSLYKDSQVLNLPLLFRSTDEVAHVREHLDARLRQGFEDSGWVVFGPVDGGFAYLMSQRPVASVSDLQKQKVWLPANDASSALVARDFGISPVSLNIGAVMTSLQTGVIDTFAAPPVAALTLQWYSRVKHITDMPLLYTFGLLGIARQHLDKLSVADQAVVREVLEETLAEMDRAERQANAQALQALHAQGLSPVTPGEADLAEWRRLAARTVELLVENGEVSATMLKTVQDLLAQYRAEH